MAVNFDKEEFKKSVSDNLKVLYRKTVEEADEYLRCFLFKLINNPVITIDIPYNDSQISHIANIRVLETVSDTSGIQERLFSGQFNRWTIQLEIQDAFLFNIPMRKNWKIMGVRLDVLEDTINDKIPIESEIVYEFDEQ